MLQRIAQLEAGSAERPSAGRRAPHRGEQEPALPLHQHNCLRAASPPAGPAPPTSCDQIRPGKASLNLRRLLGLGISSRPHLHSGVGRHPPPAQAGAPDGVAGTNRPRGSFLAHQGQEETVTKCLETHRACQETVCDVGEGTSRFLPQKKTLALDAVNHAQPLPRHFINSLPEYHFLAHRPPSGVKVMRNGPQPT